MTPTPCLHAYHGSYITTKAFGHTPDYWVRRLKRKGPLRQTIYNPARRHFFHVIFLHSQFDSLYSSSMPSNRLSNLQSCWEYLAANSTWPYTKLTGISFPSGPAGPTSAMWFGSALVYRVFTWPRLPLHLVGRLISSIAGSATVLLEAALPAPQCLWAGR